MYFTWRVNDKCHTLGHIDLSSNISMNDTHSVPLKQMILLYETDSETGLAVDYIHVSEWYTAQCRLFTEYVNQYMHYRKCGV